MLITTYYTLLPIDNISTHTIITEFEYIKCCVSLFNNIMVSCYYYCASTMVSIIIIIDMLVIAFNCYCDSKLVILLYIEMYIEMYIELYHYYCMLSC